MMNLQETKKKEMTKLSKEENKNAWLEQMKMKVTIP